MCAILSVVIAFLLSFYVCVYSPALFIVDMFQDLQWMPEAIDSNKPYIYYVFFLYTHTFSRKGN